MRTYVGIDLGTTNSAICTFDGETLRLYKSPEQHDVTPSAIFIDRRGSRYVGIRAYNNAARNPDSAAVLFKRLMGTSTPITLPAVGQTMTPEDCSAEVLRVLFGYLPEELRNSQDTATVITVPAAFNQMQKDATMSAADEAGIGQVALMQEPVAAFMSVMQQRKSDGVFLVYDFGGGTLDIAIAESIAGRVSLLAHGGIAMCGGRDFDRGLLDNVVKPWLLEHFTLPADFTANPQFKSLVRMATWAAEKAKIELSARTEAIISLSEAELSARDLAGQEIYLDIPVQRSMLDALIAPRIADSITAARATMTKAGLSAHDIERVVFVGGPTQYKPLRDKVAFELGIAGSTDVNPMTAVAEGAALFAESIDWSSQTRGRKSMRGTVTAEGSLQLTFNYTARTQDSRGRIIAKIAGAAAPGTAFQVDSLDTGWSSGRVPLKDGVAVDVALGRSGDNTFKIFVFDAAGGSIPLAQNRIVITRIVATIDAIPSSASIGVEVLDRLGGQPVLDYLVKEGDPLPQKGVKTFKTTESLRAGGGGSINFKIWEGDIVDPVTDNRFVGCFSITGQDFADGVITAGTELECTYELLDSGNIVLEVNVPSIGSTFHSGRNFYSRRAGEIDYTKAAHHVHEEAQEVRTRVEALAATVEDPRLQQALKKLTEAAAMDPAETNPETAKEAMDGILAAKKLLAYVRRDHLKEIRQIELDQCDEFFRAHVRAHARPAEVAAFENLLRTAERAIDGRGPDFEYHLNGLKQKNFEILWRQDWFIVTRFEWLAEAAYLFPDGVRHAELVVAGRDAITKDDIDRLRNVVAELDYLKIGAGPESDMLTATNLLRGG
jgi:molecular chaperone DnaK